MVGSRTSIALVMAIALTGVASADDPSGTLPKPASLCPASQRPGTEGAATPDPKAAGLVLYPASERPATADQPPPGAFGADGCPLGCDGCYPGNRTYFRGEFLWWNIRGSPTPPLVTTAPNPVRVVNVPVPGAIGTPGTTILIGDSDQNGGFHPGGRFAAGYWFTCDHALGIEGSFLFLGQRNQTFITSGDGSSTIGRPFFDVTPGAVPHENIEVVAGGVGATRQINGGVVINNQTEFWGAEGNLRTNLYCNENCFVDLVGGYRGLALDDTLNINEDSTTAVRIAHRGVIAAANTNFRVLDNFDTRDRFNGGQLGFDCEYRYGRWSVDLTGKCAVGNNRQTVDITGSTVITNPAGVPTTQTGGLLALQTNIGSYSRNVVSIVPEVAIGIDYTLGCNARLFVAYNFVYWNEVARPGSEIDRAVNTRELPGVKPSGPARPAFNFNNTDFWAQGLDVGLEVRW
jgi:hypothetical protein